MPDIAEHGNGDTDADGDVDGNDFITWQQEYGSGWLPSIAIPEPSACILYLLLALATLALAHYPVMAWFVRR